MHKDTLAVPGHPYAVNVIRTIQQLFGSGVESGVALILDIDVVTTQGFDLGETLLEPRLLEMRWLKNKVFIWQYYQESARDVPMLMEVTASAIISLGGVPPDWCQRYSPICCVPKSNKGVATLQDSYAFGLTGKGGIWRTFIRLAKNVASLIGTVTERGQC